MFCMRFYIGGKVSIRMVDEDGFKGIVLGPEMVLGADDVSCYDQQLIIGTQSGESPPYIFNLISNLDYILHHSCAPPFI